MYGSLISNKRKRDMKIHGVSLDELIDLVQKVMAQLKASCDVQGDSGYITVLDAVTGAVLFTCMANNCPAETAGRHYDSSREQAIRLFSNPGQVTSFESRDPASDEWGGAIRAGSLIISFAGLDDELVNEAVVCGVACRTHWVFRGRDFARIFEISRNPYLSSLMVVSQ